MHKNLISLLTLVLFCLSPVNVQAQQQHSWEKYLDELTTEETGDIGVSEDMFDVLSDLEENPVNINTATREDLERIPFLTAQQIEDILAYVYQYHGMKTTDELSAIRSLDAISRRMLQYFVYAGKTDEKATFPKFKDIIRNGRHEVLATGNIPFYKRAGDRNGFLGYKYRHSLRYEFNYDEYVKFGVQGTQDAGEPFFAGRNNKGYDYYTYYLVIRKLGRIKTLALGQYKLRMGMGLVMNSDFGFGKLSTLSNLGRSNNTIRANTSRSQANYLQGAAATVSIAKGLDITGFISYRPIDATLNKSGNISTILKTGYHRTEREMAKKNDARQLVTGGNLNWQGHGFHAGLTGIYSHLDKELQPNTKRLYMKYYPSGSNFWNASVDYGYISHYITFNGETATGSSHGIATINSLSFTPSGRLSIMALQRFYSKKYSSLFAQSFSDGGRVQNESGMFLGVNWQLHRNLNIMAYTDYAYFAQPRYQASHSSHSWENNISATWAKKGWTVTGRYRLKIRQKDDAKKVDFIDDITNRGRLLVGYGTKKWLARVQGDVAYNSYKTNSFGWMTSATGGLGVWRLRFVATFGYFHTENYASRIYSYERGPMYSFSFPAFYGEGIRYALFVRADFTKSLMFIAKCGTTDYFDRGHISSGLQKIDHSSQTDMELQLRWRF